MRDISSKLKDIPGDWLSAAQVAKRTGLDLDQLGRLRAMGRGPLALTFLRWWVYPKLEFDAWLQEVVQPALAKLPTDATPQQKRKAAWMAARGPR